VSNNYIIGIDPGESTGVALFKNFEFKHTLQGPPDDMITMVEIMLSKIAEDDVCKIAMERFIDNRRVKTQQPTAQQVIGAIKAIARRAHVRVVDQGPADAHALASNDLLQKLGRYTAGEQIGSADAVDANMATRHALLLMAKEHASHFTALVTAL
jgi:hypothetical protein